LDVTYDTDKNSATSILFLTSVRLIGQYSPHLSDPGGRNGKSTLEGSKVAFKT
jgi:hypothetical protein